MTDRRKTGVAAAVVAAAGVLVAIALGRHAGERARPPAAERGPGAGAPVAPGTGGPAAPSGAILGVVTRRGAPAAGTAVELRRRPDPPGDRPAFCREYFHPEDELKSPPIGGPPLAATAADAEGRFKIEGLSPGGYQVRAVAADGVASSARVEIGAPGATVEVRIAIPGGACAVRGRARYEDRRPFSGFVTADQDEYADHRAEPAIVPTDAAGRFAIAGLDPGPVRLSCLVPGSFRYDRGPLLLPCEDDVELVVDAGAVDVRGRIVDAAGGTPIAGAEVFMGSGSWPSGWNLRVVTGPDGRFLARVVPDLHEVVARAEGFAPASLWVWDSWDEGKEILLRLGRYGRIEGQVLADPSGEPVPGVPVFLLPVQGVTGGARLPVEAYRVVSDAGGRFTLERVPGIEVRLFACGNGYVSAALGFAGSHLDYDPLALELPSGGTKTVVLRVVAAARVEGRVLATDGQPIAGAMAAAGSWSADGTSVTDGEGRFRLGDLPPEATVGLRIVASGRPGLRRTVRTGGPGSTTPIEIRLPAGRLVEVAVVDRESGGPVEGAMVFATGSRWWQELTGSDGIARLPPLPAEKTAFTVTHRDYVPMAAAVALSPGDRDTRLTIALARGLSIDGRVFLPDGQPAAIGVVSTSHKVRPAGPRGGSEVETPIAPDGSFRLSGLAPGEYRVNAGARIGPVDYGAEARVEAGASGLVLALAEVVRPPPEIPPVLVRVLDPDGCPVPHASLLVWSEDEIEDAEVLDGEATLCPHGGGEEEWSLEVFGARDFSWARMPLGSVVVRPVPDEGVLVLRLPPERTIEGRVLGPAGEGIAGVRVSAYSSPAGDRRGAACTGADGSFMIGGLGTEDYEVKAQPPPGFRWAEPILVPAGTKGVEIRLDAGRTVRIAVRDDGGAPVPGASVQVDDPAGVTGPDGTLTIRGLDPERSTLDVRVDPPEERPDLAGSGPLTVDLTDLGDRAFTVVLPRGLGVHGEVRDASGRPVPGARVAMLKADGFVDGETTSCLDGTFDLGRLPSGSGPSGSWRCRGRRSRNSGPTAPSLFRRGPPSSSSTRRGRSSPSAS